MMDSFEFNKIAGGVLSALLVIFASKTLIGIAQSGHGHDEHAKPGYALPMPKEGAASAVAAPAAAAFNAGQVVAQISKASVEGGQAVFKKCGACHTGEKGGPNKVGPNLWGIVGRKGGSHEGFAYSEGMKAQPSWTLESLATFVHNPKGTVPGTKMVFAGIEETGDLADLLSYLRTLSDNPAPLPK